MKRFVLVLLCFLYVACQPKKNKTPTKRNAKQADATQCLPDSSGSQVALAELPDLEPLPIGNTKSTRASKIEVNPQDLGSDHQTTEVSLKLFDESDVDKIEWIACTIDGVNRLGCKEGRSPFARFKINKLPQSPVEIKARSCFREERKPKDGRLCGDWIKIIYSQPQNADKTLDSMNENLDNLNKRLYQELEKLHNQMKSSLSSAGLAQNTRPMTMEEKLIYYNVYAGVDNLFYETTKLDIMVEDIKASVQSQNALYLADGSAQNSDQNCLDPQTTGSDSLVEDDTFQETDFDSILNSLDTSDQSSGFSDSLPPAPDAIAAPESTLDSDLDETLADSNSLSGEGLSDEEVNQLFPVAEDQIEQRKIDPNSDIDETKKKSDSVLDNEYQRFTIMAIGAITLGYAGVKAYKAYKSSVDQSNAVDQMIEKVNKYMKEKTIMLGDSRLIDRNSHKETQVRRHLDDVRQILKQEIEGFKIRDASGKEVSRWGTLNNKGKSSSSRAVWKLMDDIVDNTTERLNVIYGDDSGLKGDDAAKAKHNRWLYSQDVTKANFNLKYGTEEPKKTLGEHKVKKKHVAGVLLGVGLIIAANVMREPSSGLTKGTGAANSKLTQFTNLDKIQELTNLIKKQKEAINNRVYKNSIKK